MIAVWPVIHVGNPTRDLENARLAQKHGAAGVMLISMQGDYIGTDECAEVIRHNFPDLKIGANYLGAEPRSALMRSWHHRYAATWTDEHDVTGRPGSPEHMFFVGVAFKGQPHQERPGRAAAQAVEWGLIPTTSGQGTGIAPSLEKLASIRSCLRPGMPLALASGATPQNISSFAPYLTHVLVSTGISDNMDRFDEAKLAAFMAAAKE